MALSDTMPVMTAALDCWVYHASPVERAKYELNRSRTMIIWDPAKCTINDEIRITDYLGPVERLG